MKVLMGRESLTWSISTTLTASKSRHLKARGNPGGKEIT